MLYVQCIIACQFLEHTIHIHLGNTNNSVHLNPTILSLNPRAKGQPYTVYYHSNHIPLNYVRRK